jgi:cytochrome c oxidase cbb3-type subunit 3
MNSELHNSRTVVLATLCAAALWTFGVAVAADRETAKADNAMPASGKAGEGSAAAVPLGDLAGGRRDTLASGIANPHAGDPQAIERGKKLFSAMNCAGCHGYDLKGAMGPNLTDTYWLYGGTPVMIYKSIYEGRPQGMPAWQQMLPTEPIWDIVAYIESLGGSFPADKFEAGIKGDLGKGDTRHAEKGASPNTSGRR